MSTQNGVRRPVPAVHFESLLQTINAEGADNKCSPANQARTQHTLTRHLLPDHPVDSTHTQNKQVSGETAEYANHHANKKNS